MINRETALESALNANQANKHHKDKKIVQTHVAYFSDQNVWFIIIAFDEYNTIGDQFFVVYHVDPENGEATHIFV